MEDNERLITFLNFDHTLTKQKFLHQFPHHWIDCSDIPHTNGFCQPDSLQMIRDKLREQHASPLVLIGNGNYHYVTYLLMERIKEPFSLVLFDHHDDMKESEFLISCGSWVSYALKNVTILNKVCIIGVNEKHITQPNRNTNGRVKIITERKLNISPLNHILDEVQTFLKGEKNIYISIDKDVLYKKEAFTNWDQGSMTLVQLLFMLEFLSARFRIAGMDICGEYLLNGSNVFKAESREYIKMNEIVNGALIRFIYDLQNRQDPSEESSFGQAGASFIDNQGTLNGNM